jgi:hypothetical protein
VRIRQRRGANGQNVDSLLDTMANVVGILVVLLAVIQLTINDAMKRIQVWESEEAVDLRQQNEEAEAQLAAIGGLDLTRTLELAKMREHIRELLSLATTPSDTASVSTNVAQMKLQVRKLEATVADKRENLANLQIRLSKAQARAEEDGVDLRLPDPRPAPLAADPLVLFCRHGRVFDPRFDQLARELQEVIRTAPRPIPRYFEAYDVGNEMLRWRVTDEATGRVHRLDWRYTDIGETAAELRSKSADLRRVFEQNDRKRRFLHFYVWGDSFEVYLEARRMAEEAGFAAGWVPIPTGKALELVKGRTPPTPVD